MDDNEIGTGQLRDAALKKIRHQLLVSFEIKSLSVIDI